MKDAHELLFIARLILIKSEQPLFHYKDQVSNKVVVFLLLLMSRKTIVQTHWVNLYSYCLLNKISYKLQTSNGLIQIIIRNNTGKNTKYTLYFIRKYMQYPWLDKKMINKHRQNKQSFIVFLGIARMFIFYEIQKYAYYYQFQIRFLKTSMTNFNTLLTNALTHIIIDGKVSQSFYIIVRIITTLQIISLVADSTEDIFQVVQWFDPSNYIEKTLIVLIGLSLSLVFLIVLFLRLLVSQKNQELVLPSTLIRYLGTFLLHLQMLCKTLLLVPFLRASLLVLQNSSDSTMLVLSTLSLVLYLVLLLPLLVYNSSNTFILTPQLNRKLNYWNTYVWSSLFRVVFVFANVLNNSAMPFLCCFYFFVYFCLTIKRPVFAYTFERTKKAMVSAVGYIALVRVFNSVVGRNSSVLVEVLGILGYIALIQLITHVRTQQILTRTEPSIYQFKLLFFMVGDLQRNMGALEHFILSHHQKCNIPVCRCSEVVRHLSSKESDLTADKIWYEFLESFVKAHYSLEDISKLPESELQARLSKYQYLVMDLVEIQLFKLGKLNEAYYILGNFASLIERKKMQSLVFDQKRAVMRFYLQQAIRKKYKVDGVTNQYADKFMNFQIQFENYRKLLLKAASKTAELWEEMNKREPYQKKLLQDLKTLQVWNYHIKMLYRNLVEQFQKAQQVVQQITNDYYQMVLNISQKSSFHLIQTPKFYDASKKRKQKIQRLSQNMQAFSYDSETPMCFVSVENENYGKIKNFNCYFSEIMKLEYGKFVSIQEFIIPEMRNYHRHKMQQFINGDFFSRQHKNGFTLNSQGHLVYTQILIQILPSLTEGLSYVIFFRKLMWQKKILGIKNMNEIVYLSQSFQNFIEDRFKGQPLMHYLTPEIQKQLKEKEKLQFNLPQGEFQLRFLHQFNQKEANYLFLQIIDINDFEFTSNITKHKSILNTASKSITKKDEIIEQADRSISNEQDSIQKNMQSSEVNQKLLQAKQKKNDERIKQTYQLILNRKERQLSTSMNIFIKVTAIIKIIIFIVSIIVKYQNENDYITATTIHSNYNDFMLLISRYSLHFKMINLYAVQNKNLAVANSMLDSLKKQPLIGTTMDSFLYIFDIPTVSQTWNTFTVNNKTVLPGSQNNFLAVSDNLINPVTNLISASNISSFNFSITLELLPTFPPSLSTFYYQLITNSLYSQLSGFRKLKQKIMNPIISDTLNNYYSILILNLLLLITILCWIFWALYKHKKILHLKNISYEILQKLRSELIRQKEQKCLRFYKKYGYIQTQLAVQNKLTRLEGNNYDKLIGANSQFDSEEQKEYQFKQGTFWEETKLEELQKTKDKTDTQLLDKKKFRIFQQSTFSTTFLKYILPCLPLLGYMIAFTALQFVQNSQLNNMLKIQQNVQNMQQNILNIRLYAMQYGTYNPNLQQYQSIPGTLQKLIAEMFAYQKIMINSKIFVYLPQLQGFIQQIYYGDVCQMQQDGKFSISNYSFYGKGNFSYCMSINSKMLTKGLISSLLNFVQSSSTLFYANPKTTQYNMTQRLAYFNDPFFTDISRLTQYFHLIFDTALQYLWSDYQNVVQDYTLAMIGACSFLIVWFIIVIFFFRRYYLNIVKWDILQIHSVFNLVTYESLVKNEYLKSIFAQKMDDFTLLE